MMFSLNLPKALCILSQVFAEQYRLQKKTISSVKTELQIIHYAT